MPLCIIFNKSVYVGTFSLRMKYAEIKPLYKSGNKKIMDNYGSISLLPVISKLPEKIMITNLMSHLDMENVLS